MLRRGSLLVATPLLVDPNFDRTVVLICAHDDDGAFGVVLNRPSTVPTAEHLPAWAETADPTVYVGGPVQPETAIGLALGIPPPGTEVLPDLGLVDVGRPPVDYPGTRRARVYAGYAGWSSGQLEAEIAEQAWFVIPGSSADVFAEPAGMWSDVLRRQRGTLAFFATYPPDPVLN